jgi:uncharacterized protein (TIGR00156 family)
MKRITPISCIAAALLAASAVAIAQPGGYTGPSTAGNGTGAAGYTGPSSVPLMTAKDLLDKGKDDQYVKLQGKLVSHKGGDDYEFADQSGKHHCRDRRRGSSRRRQHRPEHGGGADRRVRQGNLRRIDARVKQIKIVGR